MRWRDTSSLGEEASENLSQVELSQMNPQIVRNKSPKTLDSQLKKETGNIHFCRRVHRSIDKASI
jgi:hypothetical protein